MTSAQDDLAARAQALVGSTIRGKYRITGLLGVGGMAAVYSALHRNGRRVAIKILHPELATRADMRERFIREGLAANAVDHPGVVAVIDDDVSESGAPFLVMELLVGQSVADYWQSNEFRLPAQSVLAIAAELLDVLAVAHRSGVIHRDIKPANLFVTEDGRVKVLDFGIASLRDLASTGLTEQGMMMGTPSFLPPEQAAGLISQVDARTDLWAVGALIFTLLSGCLVHDGESLQHIAVLAATKPARSLATVLPDAAPEIIALVDRALKLDKTQRWQDAETMRQAVLAASGQLTPEDSRRSARALNAPIPALLRNADTTTSHPVSSSSVPPAKPNSSPQHTVRLQTVATSLADSFRRFRVVVGGGATPPSSIDPAAALPSDEITALTPRQQAMRRRARVAVFFGALLAGTLVAVQQTHSSQRARLEATAIPAEVEPPAAWPDPPPVPSNATTTPPAAASSTPPAAASSTPPKERPAVHAAPRRPAATPSARPGCSPPYTIDPSGKTIWKPDCLP